MSESLIFRAPAEADEAAVLAYVQDFAARGESTDGSAGAHKVTDCQRYAQWLAAIRQNSREETVAPGLDYCRDTLRQPRVLITCDSDNPASAGTILRCGGVLEDERPREDGKTTQRYWIAL